MQSLRNKQIREVLDEDMNVNRRVFDREKEQVRVFQENILPKKTRDMEAEIGVDKLIENINKILENKLSSLEYLLSKITGTSDIGDAEGRRSYNAIISNGDFITAFNQLVRVYTTQGISRNSQEIIKVKFQEIKPNIDAIIYGIEELVQYLFESGKSDKEIFQLVRSQAVYDIVKGQLYRGASYKIIEQGDIEVSIKEVLAELSEIQRAELHDISGRDITEKSLLKLPIEIGDDEERIKQLEAEMGFKLPRERRGELQELGRKEKEQAFSTFGNMGKSVVAMERQEFDDYMTDARMRADALINDSKAIKRELRRVAVEQKMLLAQKEQLLLGQRQFGEVDEKGNEIEIADPLVDELAQNNARQTGLMQNLVANEQETQSLKDDVEQNKLIFEEKLRKGMNDQGELPLRKKKVKSLVPEPEPEPADEKAEAPPSASSSALPLIDYYTRDYLESLPSTRLRIVAAKYNYTPHRNTDDEKIVREILKRQPFVPKERRKYVGEGMGSRRGMGRQDQENEDDEDYLRIGNGKIGNSKNAGFRGGNFSHYGIDDEDERNCRIMCGGAYQGMIVSNPMLWRGRPQRIERPYVVERIQKSFQNRDYGNDDEDADNHLFNFTRGGARFFDDSRNDIYKIQQAMKRGY